MSFKQDFKIFMTIKKVFVREDIGARDKRENIDLDQVRSVQR